MVSKNSKICTSAHPHYATAVVLTVKYNNPPPFLRVTIDNCVTVLYLLFQVGFVHSSQQRVQMMRHQVFMKEEMIPSVHHQFLRQESTAPSPQSCGSVCMESRCAVTNLIQNISFIVWMERGWRTCTKHLVHQVLMLTNHVQEQS